MDQIVWFKGAVIRVFLNITLKIVKKMNVRFRFFVKYWLTYSAKSRRIGGVR